MGQSLGQLMILYLPAPFQPQPLTSCPSQDAEAIARQRGHNDVAELLHVSATSTSTAAIPASSERSKASKLNAGSRTVLVAPSHLADLEVTEIDCLLNLLGSLREGQNPTPCVLDCVLSSIPTCFQCICIVLQDSSKHVKPATLKRLWRLPRASASLSAHAGTMGEMAAPLSLRETSSVARLSDVLAAELGRRDLDLQCRG